MGAPKFYLAYGGGLGDVVWDYMRDKCAWRIAPLVNTYGAFIRVYTLCHNDGVDDIFRYNPFISEHIQEPWRLPNPEDHQKYNQPIDDFLPLHRDEYYVGPYGQLEGTKPELYLSNVEQQQLVALIGQRPLIVLQPYGGLSERDAFNPKSMRRLVNQLVELEPSVRVVIVGKNHGREQRPEVVGFKHPNVVDMIDKLGIRMSYFLVRHADAFAGAHSNLIRTAWDWRIRNACILPAPLMTDRLQTLDPKYTYGWKFPESRIFSFPYGGAGTDQNFESLDTETLARHLLGR